MDDRKEAPNVDYWFNVIKLLGKGSPVLLVRNQKKIDSSTGFDHLKFRSRYGGFFKIEYLEVDLSKSDKRLDTAERKVKEMLSGLDHIGDPLPAGWVGVRRELALLKEDHVPFSVFTGLCRDQEIEEERDQLVLLRYFHSLGLLFHYEESRCGLADVVFLNPNWITGAVYAVFADKELEKRGGAFTKEWLFGKWSDADYVFEEKNRLLLLMQKEEFDLCYPVRGGDEETFLVPHALADVAPDRANEWERKGTLSFRYRYAFLPAGIVSRLIVRLYRWIAGDENGQDLVWKSGVILEKDGLSALVKEDRTRDGAKVIDVSIRGGGYEGRDFLSRIRSQLEDVHEVSFSGIDCDLLVPCCCPACGDHEERTYFEESRLREYVNRRLWEIRCEKDFRMVSIRELLEGVAPPDRPEEREGLRHGEFRREKTSDKIGELLEELNRLRRDGPSGVTINTGGGNANLGAGAGHAVTVAKTPTVEPGGGFRAWSGWLFGIIAALVAVATYFGWVPGAK